MIRSSQQARLGRRFRMERNTGSRPAVLPLLTADQEFQLVRELCSIRATIERVIRPLIPEVERFRHFDQIVPEFLRQALGSAKVRRQVNVRLNKYAKIKHELVVRNLAWVTKLSRRHHNSQVSEEDLFQEGVCGLLKAIDRFEASRGLRLMTYATWYILEAMQQIRARQSHLVALSVHDQTLLGRVEELRRKFQHTHERQPTHAEIAHALGRPMINLLKLESAAAPSIRLDRGQDESAIPVATTDPRDELDRLSETRRMVSGFLNNLSHRERLVLTRRFGLDGSAPTSLEALGESMELSKECVRQLQRQAIKRLQVLAREEQRVLGA